MRAEEVARVLSAFERHAVDYVLIGSIAMAAQGLIRATQDVDFFVSPSPENVDRIKAALRTLFDDDSIDEIGADDLAGRYPVLRYGPPEGEFVIDLIARLGDAFEFGDLEWETVRFEGVDVKVATPRMLFEMKRSTLRPQDLLDAQQLRDRFGLDDPPA